MKWYKTVLNKCDVPIRATVTRRYKNEIGKDDGVVESGEIPPGKSEVLLIADAPEMPFINLIEFWVVWDREKKHWPSGRVEAEGDRTDNQYNMYDSIVFGPLEENASGVMEVWCDGFNQAEGPP